LALQKKSQKKKIDIFGRRAPLTKKPFLIKEMQNTLHASKRRYIFNLNNIET